MAKLYKTYPNILQSGCCLSIALWANGQQPCQSTKTPRSFQPCIRSYSATDGGQGIWDTNKHCLAEVVLRTAAPVIQTWKPWENEQMQLGLKANMNSVATTILQLTKRCNPGVPDRAPIPRRPARCRALGATVAARDRETWVWLSVWKRKWSHILQPSGQHGNRETTNHDGIFGPAKKCVGQNHHVHLGAEH